MDRMVGSLLAGEPCSSHWARRNRLTMLVFCRVQDRRVISPGLRHLKSAGMSKIDHDAGF
jgi:hypothetical protein